MKMKQELMTAWANIKKPRGFIADIESADEAWHEYADVEKYYADRYWDEVNPDAHEIRYMSPSLTWMNKSAAKYYAQSYLAYLLSPEALTTKYDTPYYIINYFEKGDAGIMSSLSEAQQKIARKIVDRYKSIAGPW